MTPSKTTTSRGSAREADRSSVTSAKMASRRHTQPHIKSATPLKTCQTQLASFHCPRIVAMLAWGLTGRIFFIMDFARSTLAPATTRLESTRLCTNIFHFAFTYNTTRQEPCNFWQRTSRPNSQHSHTRICQQRHGSSTISQLIHSSPTLVSTFPKNRFSLRAVAVTKTSTSCSATQPKSTALCPPFSNARYNSNQQLAWDSYCRGKLFSNCCSSAAKPMTLGSSIPAPQNITLTSNSALGVTGTPSADRRRCNNRMHRSGRRCRFPKLSIRWRQPGDAGRQPSCLSETSYHADTLVYSIALNIFEVNVAKSVIL